MRVQGERISSWSTCKLMRIGNLPISCCRLDCSDLFFLTAAHCLLDARVLSLSIVSCQPLSANAPRLRAVKCLLSLN